MGDELQGIDEDVDFDDAGAVALIARLNEAAAALDGQRQPRLNAGQAALRDWVGPHATNFRGRLAVADADIREVAEALREAARQVKELQEMAAEEQERREAGRAYVRALEENDRNESLANKLKDTFTKEDFRPPPKPGPPIQPKHVTAPAPSTTDRTTV